MISVDVYLFTGAQRTLQLADGEKAVIKLVTQMPWEGHCEISVEAPQGWSWRLAIPKPEYASSYKVRKSWLYHHTNDNAHVQISGAKIDHSENGYNFVRLLSASRITVDFEMPAQLLASHPLTGSDTLTLQRGPIVYTAESVDNVELETDHPHFEGLGIRSDTTFHATNKDIAGLTVIMLETESTGAYVSAGIDERRLYRPVQAEEQRWVALEKPLVFVPWFARANRGGKGHVRTAFRRVV